MHFYLGKEIFAHLFLIFNYVLFYLSLHCMKAFLNMLDNRQANYGATIEKSSKWIVNEHRDYYKMHAFPKGL